MFGRSRWFPKVFQPRDVTVTPMGAIDACLFAPFTSAEASNLILCKGDHLEVYDVEGSKQHRLVFSLLVPLFGRPDALATYRPSAGSRENLAVLFRRGSYLAVLQYEPELGSVRTVGQHALVPPGDLAATAAAVEFRPQVSVDPEHRCLACRVLPDRVLVFPVSAEAAWRAAALGPAVHEHDGMAFHQDPSQRPGLAAPFSFTAWAPLRLHHLEDVRLLHGYHQPTAACLGQSKPGWGGSLCESNTDNSDILIVAFNLAEKVAHVVWAIRGLPHDLFQVIPLQVPLGGLLALANNAVFYVKEHGISFCQTLNKNTTLGGEFSRKDMQVKDETALGIVLSGCSAVVLSPTVVLLSVQPTGRLWLAHLVHTTRDVVDDIVWTCPGTGAPVLDLCAAREELLFLAAADRGTLLQMSASKKKRPKDPREPEKKAARTQEPGGDKEGDGEGQEGGEGEAARAPAEPAAEPSEALRALLATHASLRDSSRSIRSYNFAVADELPSLGAVRCMQLWGDKASGDEEFELPAAPKFSAAWSIHREPVEEEPVIADASEATPGLGAKPSGGKRAFAEGPGASAGAEAPTRRGAAAFQLVIKNGFLEALGVVDVQPSLPRARSDGDLCRPSGRCPVALAGGAAPLAPCRASPLSTPRTTSTSMQDSHGSVGGLGGEDEDSQSGVEGWLETPSGAVHAPVSAPAVSTIGIQANENVDDIICPTCGSVGVLHVCGHWQCTTLTCRPTWYQRLEAKKWLVPRTPTRMPIEQFLQTRERCSDCRPEHRCLKGACHRYCNFVFRRGTCKYGAKCSFCHLHGRGNASGEFKGEVNGAAGNP
ncbi:unnamed protein product [Prorocentrum cordatum]|uniref:C3H1-type domain-containing protein n=1 Tax=Prorocentrum cordatum TaxID=2364126 RepID=A0ABN9PPX8_9DINO|nr:unnamed protein product [Polarella glacialis]